MKIFGVEYTSPKSIHDYPRVRIPDEIQHLAYEYCQENFDENWIWSSSLQTNYTDIFFLEPEDALLCRLRFLAYPTA
jgi:hypothetical protein